MTPSLLPSPPRVRLTRLSRGELAALTHGK